MVQNKARITDYMRPYHINVMFWDTYYIVQTINQSMLHGLNYCNTYVTVNYI